MLPVDVKGIMKAIFPISMNIRSIQSVFRSKYILWAILAFPGIMITNGLISGQLSYDQFMHISGEMSVRALIFTFMATPLTLMLPGKRFSKWLMRNRRYFGVASGLYGVYHTLYYLFYIDLQQILGEFFDLAIITGWIAIFIFIPLLITSNDFFVRRMGKNWKRLQRWAYLAGITIILHWAFLSYNESGNIGPALVHLAPVAILEIYRVWKQYDNRRKRKASSVKMA